MKIFLPIFMATLLLTACGGGQKEGDTKSEKDYEKSKESLEQTEQKNPAKFITVDGDKKKNLLGQTVVRADINNNAKIVTYKDVDVKITFYSKTGTVLEEDHETIYENIAPGTSVHFKSKFFTPKGTDSVSFKVVDAKY
jgi:hypothetical protein